jgi:uncharacterized membrane protein HdeD (DUF308 family)
VAGAASDRGEHLLLKPKKTPDETKVKITITRAALKITTCRGKLKKTEMSISLGVARIIGLIMFSLGAVALVASVISTFSSLAFACSTLVLLGAIMIYVPVARYMKRPRLQTRGARMLQKMNISKARTNSAKLASSLLLIAGILLLIGSSFGASTVFAFIGLSLTFWGALLLYIRPSKYVKSELLVSLQSPLENIDKIIKETKHEGKGIYLPPKSLKDITKSIIMVPQKPITQLPQLEEVSSDKLWTNNPKGLYLTPPGLSLCQLFEKTIGTPFMAMNLESLKEKMPKLFIENLEIAENLNIQTENNTITVEMKKNVFAPLCQETTKLEKIHNSIGCPLCSAIACVLARTTGKPITIEKEQTSEETTTIQYHVLED